MAWDSKICVRTSIEVPSTRLRTEMVYPFAVEYEQVVKHVIRLGDPSRPVVIGSPARPRTCRICLRDEATVNFRNVAHIIPQGWGNRPLQSREECDQCNAKFGRTIDQDFLSFAAPLRALATFPTAAGGFKLRVGARRSYIESGSQDGTAPPSIYVEDDAVSLHRHGPDTLVLGALVPGFRPMGVAQALARMGYMVLPPALLPSFNHLQSWLSGESHGLPTSFAAVMLPGSPAPQVELAVYRRREPSGGPPLVVEFLFGNSGWYWYSPAADQCETAPLPLPTILESATPPGLPTGIRYDVHTDGVIRGHRMELLVRIDDLPQQPAGDLRAFLDALPPVPDLESR